MATGTGSTTRTAALTRTEALIRTLDLLVGGTTGSKTFHEVIEAGVKNQWIKTVTVDGLAQDGKIRQQIEVEIDWDEHRLRLKDTNKGEISVNLALDESSWISRVIGQIIEGFNEIKEQGDLEAVWSVRYTPEARAKESDVDRILGLSTARDSDWEEGKLELIIDRFRPKKLSEASFTWKVVTKY